MKLKRILTATAISALMLSAATAPAMAGDRAPAKKKPESISFVVGSDKATIAANDQGKIILTMTKVDPSVAWFADRPARNSGVLKVSKIPAIWTSGGKNSFKAVPPNAAVTTHTADGKMHVALVTLTKPMFDAKAGSMSFQVTPLKGSKVVKSGNLGQTNVFIDNYTFQDFMNCLLFGEDC
jgi:hypothetical protein